MPIRIIQVGLGAWGLAWEPVLRQSADVELVGCVDSSPAALAQAQTRSGVPAERWFPTLDAAFAAVEADAVLITTSINGHVPVALSALAADKHVLLEKPFAPTVDAARQVVEAANARRVLMISQNYRFFPAVRAVAALVREGRLGAVGDISIDFRRNADRLWPADHRIYQIEQPLLVDMSIHHFDLMRLVLGQEPQRVFCQTWNPPRSNYNSPPAAAATITFDGGTVVNYRGSWLSRAPQTAWAGVWRMECTEGEISWASRGDRGAGDDRVSVRLAGKAAHRLELPILPTTGRAAVLAAFVQAIRAGHEPESSGRANLGSVALMSAAVESARSGLPQPIATAATTLNVGQP